MKTVFVRPILLDEPLSNLDARLRMQMRTEIARLQRRLATTTVYVTHDQTEAMRLGDRIAVLQRGELQQVGTPRELYEQPNNLFVAGFIGSPAMNFLPAELPDERRIKLPVGEFSLPDHTGRYRAPGRLTTSRDSVARSMLSSGWAPNCLYIAKPETGARPRYPHCLTRLRQTWPTPTGCDWWRASIPRPTSGPATRSNWVWICAGYTCSPPLIDDD